MRGRLGCVKIWDNSMTGTRAWAWGISKRKLQFIENCRSALAVEKIHEAGHPHCGLEKGMLCVLADKYLHINTRCNWTLLRSA